MISAVVVIGKINNYAYVVRAEDWLNPKMYSMDAQDPYTGDTNVIIKADYKIGWVLDEHGEANYSF